jgi:hypothetical protein
MGYTEPELYETDRQLLETLLERTGLGLDFDTLAARGTVTTSDEPRVQFAELRFPTPSGKIELVSARAEADGLPATRCRSPIAAPRRGTSGCSRRPRPGCSTTASPTTARSHAASARPPSPSTPTTPRRAASPKATRQTSPTPPAASS